MAECGKKKPTLAYEAAFMTSLAVLQLIFIPLFIVWRHYAVFSDGNEAEARNNEEQQKIREKAEKVDKLFKQC